jgi:hypothetical protein
MDPEASLFPISRRRQDLAAGTDISAAAVSATVAAGANVDVERGSRGTAGPDGRLS